MSPRATKAEGVVLFSEMTPDPAWEAEFNDWYDHEHIPLRMAVPGFLSAQRYRASGVPNYLAVYEIQSAEVLQSQAYQNVKNNPSPRTARMLRGVTGFTRYLGIQIHEQTAIRAESAIDAPVLYSMFFEVPAERAVDFAGWHDDEHVPRLLQCKDWLLVRRFQIISGEPKSWTHLVLYYLAHQRALLSAEPERALAIQGNWLERQCCIFEKYGPRHIGNSI